MLLVDAAIASEEACEVGPILDDVLLLAAFRDGEVAFMLRQAVQGARLEVIADEEVV